MRTAGKFLFVRLRRFTACAGAATAVEFALVAAPFCALLIAILQTALVFLAQQVLQTATTEGARLVMTGQAQTQKLTAAQFQQDVCGFASALFTCSNIYVNVQTFTSFSGMTQTSPLQNGQFQSADMNFGTGGPGDVVLMQVFYQWPIVLGPLGFNLSNMSGNNRLLVGTAVFRNEPY
ncbi:MAG TPA: TadE/TadG family type IV pilus assembly protein [Rhizomicrobium sp.]|jgi:Flp pilus assembly protein TadG|nr:TadE/TadG family type IV pilus assembly protein [Rhizomicrobium sp.]